MNDIQQTCQLIRKDFHLTDDEFVQIQDRAALKAALSRVIHYLLDHDMSRLLQALYRIDVAESSVKHILAYAVSDAMAGELADLVIDRQLQKVITRNKYRSS